MSMFLGIISYIIQIFVILTIVDCCYYLKKIHSELVKMNKNGEKLTDE